MGKLALQFTFIIASFFVMWNLLDRVDWMTVLHVEKAKKTIEEKLGETYWEVFKSSEDEILDEKIVTAVDKLLSRLCTENDINRDKIKLHIVANSDVNAFALPDGHLVLYSGLIQDSENEAELSGVLAHEVAHLELGHLMKKLVKEVGLAMLISMTSGNGNPEMIRHALKVITSSAFDRNLEREADLKAIDYLVNSGISPEGLANFLFRMSSSESIIPDQLFWLSTHPGGEERSIDILQYLDGLPFSEEQILTDEEWNSFQESMLSY